MDFVSIFGTVVDKREPAKVDPREAFIRNADKQIGFLQNGVPADEKAWFSQEGGQFRVRLCNGFKNMPLDATGRVHVMVESKEKIVAMLEHAKRLCNEGKFDQLFIETKVVRTPGARKKKAEATAEA